VTGRLYNASNKPPLKPDDRIQNTILTPYQHRLHFDDKKASITLKYRRSGTVYLGTKKKTRTTGTTSSSRPRTGTSCKLAKGNTHKGSCSRPQKKHKAEIRDDPDPGIFLEDADGKLKVFIDMQEQDDQRRQRREERDPDPVRRRERHRESPRRSPSTPRNEVAIKAGTKVEISAPTVSVKGSRRSRSRDASKIEAQNSARAVGMKASFEERRWPT